MNHHLTLLAKSLLLTALAMPLSATADKVMYKVVGKDGKVTYTDKKPVGNVKYETLKLRAKRPSAPQQEYQSIQIASPADGLTVPADQSEVAVKLALTPALKPDHRIQLVFNGNPVDESDNNVRFVLGNLEQGSHQIQINILDQNNNTISRSDSVTIKVERPAEATTPKS